jgi:hypothetical protein
MSAGSSASVYRIRSGALLVCDTSIIEMRFLIIGLAVTFLPANLCQAQKAETWQGLRFGMTEGEVKPILSRKGIKLIPSKQANSEDSENDWEAKQSDYKLRLLFKVTLRFRSGRLDLIDLYLDADRIERDHSVERQILAAIANKALFAMLMGKYGKPITQKGFCGDVSSRDIMSGDRKCEVSWSADGQVVSYDWEWYKTLNELFVLIKYKPQTSDL